jgi:sigma-B regulation protein RsbU (phosphoserine phosphatase)
VFYGVLDPVARRLSYANAGHPYAFRVPSAGDPERLEATAPPIGLATPGAIEQRQLPWSADDLLCLCTDGLVDARNAAGERFGERRLLQIVLAHRTMPPEQILQEVYAEAEGFAAPPIDDRTLLVMRLGRETATRGER